MKIIFDIDGTMTDYRAYIEKYSLPWFFKKYGLLPQKIDALELEDILNLENTLKEKLNCTSEQAKLETKKLLEQYWFSHRFVHFTLLTRFRPSCTFTIKKLKKMGFQIEIYTSRAHTTDQNLIGWFARSCTIGQLWLNAVWLRPSCVHYFQDDDDKLEAIIQANPQLVVDDKVNILNALYQKGISSVCMAGPHNTALQTTNKLVRINGYCDLPLEELLKSVIGKDFVYYCRSAKSDRLWRRLLFLVPFVRWYFHPIVLNFSRRVISDGPILYAPNHRSTLDPLVILAVVKENIHWAALQRFFQAEDSIFNNNKNPLLCKLTSWLFRSLDYFPIERRSDNPYANNTYAIRDIVGYLRISKKVGIFGEGTIRRPKHMDFGIFDKSLVTLAKKTGAWLQPITICWVKTRKAVPQAIINFGTPFKVKNMDNETAMQMFLDIQKQCLRENTDIAKRLWQPKL